MRAKLAVCIASGIMAFPEIINKWCLFGIHMNEPEIIITGDGSHTLLMPFMNETYHSRNGAIQESIHVFISAGLQWKSAIQKKIRILEVGFGTGLNAALTRVVAQNESLFVNYVALEPNPLSIAITNRLNYHQHSAGIKQNQFNELHEWPLEILNDKDANFHFIKYFRTLQSFGKSETGFDLVYFDVFAPTTEPELWKPEIFLALFEIMQPRAALVTYCAKGQVKRDLIASGFNVERLAGPPGKREMLRAIKPDFNIS